MNNMPQKRALACLCALLIACQLNSVQAAPPAPVEVKPNDTLSDIVFLAYPEYGNRQAAMQVILEKNPGAFINNDINRLIVGRVLQFPDVSELPVAAPRIQAPKPVEPAETATQLHQETLQQLEKISQERDRLAFVLTELEAENKALQGKISELENLKSEQDDQLGLLEKQIQDLQTVAKSNATQLDSTSKASQEKLEQLETQNTSLQNQNSQLEEQLTNQQKSTDSSKTELDTLQQRLDTLKTEQATNQSQQKQELEKLQNTNATLQADNTKLLEKLQSTSSSLKSDNNATQEQLDTIRAQLTSSTKEVEQLKADLDQLNQKNSELTDNLEVLNTQNADLQSTLDASNQQNIALQNNISQIKASATNDVQLLQEKKQTLQNKNPLWPWLLALLLLPIAWLLGRRSRPALEQGIVTADLADKPLPQDLTTATNDPGIPTALPGELDNVAKLNIPVRPDDPDTAIKLDMARAYLDLRDSEAANDMLKEVISEGGTQQQKEAREILSFIN